jgi:hypothetical protein
MQCDGPLHSCLCHRHVCVSHVQDTLGTFRNFRNLQDQQILTEIALGKK